MNSYIYLDFDMACCGHVVGAAACAVDSILRVQRGNKFSVAVQPLARLRTRPFASGHIDKWSPFAFRDSAPHGIGELRVNNHLRSFSRNRIYYIIIKSLNH